MDSKHPIFVCIRALIVLALAPLIVAVGIALLLWSAILVSGALLIDIVLSPLYLVHFAVFNDFGFGTFHGFYLFRHITKADETSAYDGMKSRLAQRHPDLTLWQYILRMPGEIIDWIRWG